MTQPKEEIDALNNLERIDMPTFDLTPYIGKFVVVETAEVFDSVHGECVRLETAPVAEIELGDEKKEIRASKILGLHKDKTGKVGIGKNSAADMFLQRHGVERFGDMIGKEVQIVPRLAKDGKEYMTFN